MRLTGFSVGAAMADLDRIKARIRQLRRMTTDRGCTEAEAMRAAEIAMALMERHGLTDADVANGESVQETMGRRRQVIDDLWPVVALVCRCRGWFERSAEGLRFRYFGRETDVLVAEYLHDVLLNAFRTECQGFRQSHEYLRRRKRHTRSAAMKAFQTGLKARLERRLEELWWLRLKRQGDVRDVAKAEAQHLQGLGRDLERRGVRLKALGSLSTPGARYSEAALAGWVAGAGVAIEPGVDGRATAQIGNRHG